PAERPDSYTLIDALKQDTAFSFIDNSVSGSKETLTYMVTNAFKKAVADLRFSDKNGRLAWGTNKDAGVRHLLRLEALSRYHLSTGGGMNIINATKQFHGPSWRMIAHL